MQSTKVLSSFLTRKSLIQASCFNQVSCYSTTKKIPLPVNKLKETFSANTQTVNGPPYDKKPFKIPLEAGKKYSWCLCGKSKSQPICDGTHKDIFLKIKQRPIRFEVEETKDYWLCMCKQTKNRPFCDGSHKSQFVQDAVTKI